MHFQPLFLFAASVAAVANFEWDCTNSLGTCNNACYAVNHNLAKGTLTYDSNKANRDPRRTASGCNKTPCTNTKYKRWGNSCDEYPYASTKEGGRKAILRCVDTTENSSEGGQLGGFYGKIKNGNKFRVWVRNYKGAKFCTSTGAKNDGSEFRKAGNTFLPAPSRRDVDFDFEDAGPGFNGTLTKFREFLDEDGEMIMTLDTDMNVTHVGSSVFSKGKWVKIMSEVH
ncbi:deoxyribonuclease NucA/NucB-domain-containing protein [Hypoxylon crocopeplum]|nr:deoxyribonuclease NucA/NucB-domain-containing protein [Hypoxylon crocopeplum]